MPQTQTDPSSWPKRADGSAKGLGFFGLLTRPDGSVSSELSMGTTDVTGHEIEIPLLVPSLSQEEVRFLLTHDPDPAQIPESIRAKAIEFARERIAQGRSIFAGPGEQRTDQYPSITRVPMPQQQTTTPTQAEHRRTLADAIREKFPGDYDQYTDESLEKAWIDKHPEYADYATDFQGERDATTSANVLRLIESGTGAGGQVLGGLIRLLPAGARDATTRTINRLLPSAAAASAGVFSGGFAAVPVAAALGAAGRAVSDANEGSVPSVRRSAAEGAVQGATTALGPILEEAAPAAQGVANALYRRVVPSATPEIAERILSAGAGPTTALNVGRIRAMAEADRPVVQTTRTVPSAIVDVTGKPFLRSVTSAAPSTEPTALDSAAQSAALAQGSQRAAMTSAERLGVGGLLARTLGLPSWVAELPAAARAATSPLVRSSMAQAIYNVAPAVPVAGPMIQRAIIAALEGSR